MAERILIVEDESTLRTNIARYLSRAGYTVSSVETGRAAIAELDRSTFDLVISDLRLPDIDGLAVLDHVRVTSPESFVLIMTAYASIESAVEALRRGAHDYVLKPMSLADLQSKVEHIARYHRLNRENARLRTLVRGDSDAMTLLRKGGRAMTDVCDMIEKVAASTANVLLLGESGTGKELVARAVHERSERASGPFVTMNVSAVPDSLVESYLFGHERGAFPGADQAREGLFRAATGGTLFLDEVGELPLPLQAKLLRAVESKEILPVGADRAIHVDTRIVAATHCDLPAMVADGRFRQDLLYRLQVVELRVPALRDRKGDVAVLAKHFVEMHARAQRKPVRAITPEAMALLSTYGWPGNVRELSNVIERAVILSSGDALTPVDLPAELAAARARSAEDGHDDAAHRPRTPASAELTTDAACNLESATVAFHRDHIARVIDRAGGNREAAAKLLGLSPATFYRYLQKVGLKGYQAET